MWTAAGCGERPSRQAVQNAHRNGCDVGDINSKSANIQSGRFPVLISGFYLIPCVAGMKLVATREARLKLELKPGDTVQVVGSRRTARVRWILTSMHGALLENQIDGFRLWQTGRLKIGEAKQK
jgi:hypothetical protein